MKLKQVLNLYKKKGETPLERIKRYKADNPEYEKVKMTYAGRLDPLASGVLMVLAGDECQMKEKYLELDKEYFVDVLLGLSTDTGDVLGIVGEYKKDAMSALAGIELSGIKEMLQTFVGKRLQKYPMYSSRTVSGVPLFEYAKGEGIDEDKIPEKEVEIFKIDFVGMKVLSAKILRDRFRETVFSVKGDFRQNIIHMSWEKLFDEIGVCDFTIISIKVSCGSGTYMRVLAENIGKVLKCPSVALNIERTRVGDNVLANSLK